MGKVADGDFNLGQHATNCRFENLLAKPSRHEVGATCSVAVLEVLQGSGEQLQHVLHLLLVALVVLQNQGPLLVRGGFLQAVQPITQLCDGKPDGVGEVNQRGVVRPSLRRDAVNAADSSVVVVFRRQLQVGRWLGVFVFRRQRDGESAGLGVVFSAFLLNPLRMSDVLKQLVIKSFPSGVQRVLPARGRNLSGNQVHQILHAVHLIHVPGQPSSGNALLSSSHLSGLLEGAVGAQAVQDVLLQSAEMLVPILDRLILSAGREVCGRRESFCSSCVGVGDIRNELRGTTVHVARHAEVASVGTFAGDFLPATHVADTRYRVNLGDFTAELLLEGECPLQELHVRLGDDLIGDWQREPNPERGSEQASVMRHLVEDSPVGILASDVVRLHRSGLQLRQVLEL